ncbi:DUF4262 domain-containing protein [Sandaracinobacter neustonicus]|uniref:DUF4262 domain-containing protein n=1 Tax=Sandaracinobacter neustonicus TaxID=1715348 RepID=UPI001F2CCA61|nr:DUF4262 domain-containing protein [Sandaracinobacter neustonicus]
MKLWPNSFERGIIQNVRTHGCQVNCIFDPEDSDPGFAYSIGFWETVQQPEVIVFGLYGKVMASMVEDMFRLCKEGLKLSDGLAIDGLLEGHTVIARTVSPEKIVPEFFNSAIWYHRRVTGQPLAAAMQLVWPGVADGLFPWDAGCDENVRRLQPALYAREFDA